jgi:hypothetical protein
MGSIFLKRMCEQPVILWSDSYFGGSPTAGIAYYQGQLVSLRQSKYQRWARRPPGALGNSEEHFLIRVPRRLLLYPLSERQVRSAFIHHVKRVSVFGSLSSYYLAEEDRYANSLKDGDWDDYHRWLETNVEEASPQPLSENYFTLDQFTELREETLPPFIKELLEISRMTLCKKD